MNNSRLFLLPVGDLHIEIGDVEGIEERTFHHEKQIIRHIKLEANVDLDVDVSQSLMGEMGEMVIKLEDDKENEKERKS